MLQKAVRKPPGRRADVEGGPAFDGDAKLLEGRLELKAPPAYKGERLSGYAELGVKGHGRPRLVLPLSVHEHLARGNDRLRLLAARRQTAFDKKPVEAKFFFFWVHED